MLLYKVATVPFVVEAVHWLCIRTSFASPNDLTESTEGLFLADMSVAAVYMSGQKFYNHIVFR